MLTDQHKEKQEKLNTPAARRILLALAGGVLPALAWVAGPRLRRLMLGGVVVSHLTVLAGLLWPNARLLHRPVRRFRATERELWLTLDDGPDGDSTAVLAQALADRGVSATFFLVAARLPDGEKLPVRLEALGHEVANHTTTHPQAFFWGLPAPMLEKEIADCSNRLRREGAARLRCFRSPVGMANLHLAPLLEKSGLRAIGWSVRALDGVECDPVVVVPRVVNAAFPGAILVMHEGKKDRHRTETSVSTVLAVVDMLLARGFRFVIPDEDRFD